MNEPRPVEVAPGGAFAYVAGEVLVQGAEARERLLELTADQVDLRARLLAAVAEQRPKRSVEVTAELPGRFVLVRGVDRPVEVVEQLRAEGFVAQPNHVFATHGGGGDHGGCGCACACVHPAARFADDLLTADPFRANPFRANPFRANPFRANPFRANPFRANPFRANEAPHSSARPADGPAFAPRELHGSGRAPLVAVLDTGLATTPPALLASSGRVTGDADEPDVDLVDHDGATHPKDGWLDPVAGHGTFIAGVVEQLAPGCRVHLPRVVHPRGDADEVTIVQQLHALLDGDAGLDAVPDVVGFSLGGPVLESPFLLRAAVARARAAGVVVVASAGNEASCAPQYPAALPGVVAVGAVGPEGPAPFTNHGSWVDACAPGVDLVSSFFASFDGKVPTVNGVDEDAFAGWASWSGTSFAAPVVIAAIAHEMVAGDCDAEEAVRRVVHAPHLLRIPGLGTVVNV